MDLLKFSSGNGKLRNRLIFNLPAGYACPNAGVCRTLLIARLVQSLTTPALMARQLLSSDALLPWQKSDLMFVTLVGTTWI